MTGQARPEAALTGGAATSPPGCVSQPESPLLTVVVPVYNEAATVDELLRRVLAAPYSKQIIVVDDGSTDGTAEALAAWEARGQIVRLRHPKNRGKGAAVRTALEHACGRLTIIQDADLEYDPQDYPLVVAPLLSGQAEVVYGSRYLQATSGKRSGGSFSRLGVVVLNLGVRLLYGLRLTDEATCYKVFPTEVLRRMDLKSERFEFCPEVTAKLCRMGLKVQEVPIHYSARSVRDGKKIRWIDGLHALSALWKWRTWRPAPRPRAPVRVHPE
jgi:glycosyltransferase involved in cell wall biosynthesis